MKTIDKLSEMFNEQKIRHTKATTTEGADYLTVGVKGDAFSGLFVQIFFDEEKMNSASLRIFDVCKFSEEKSLTMLKTVNILNNKYRWVTFSISPERKMNAGMDVYYTEETACEVLFRALNHMGSVVDSAYPDVMKALYT